MNSKKILGVVSGIVGGLSYVSLAFADSSAFSVSDATSTVNTLYGNIETVLMYGLGTLIIGGVGMLLLGFFWRHGKKLITGKKF